MAEKVDNFPPVPYSITNPLFDRENSRDIESPLSLIDFIKLTGDIVAPINQTSAYNAYISKWSIVKERNATDSSLLVIEAYRNFIKDIAVDYNTIGENKFLSEVDYSDPYDIEVLLSFITRKIKDIAIYYSKKREDVKLQPSRVKLKGSLTGIRTAIKEKIADYLKVNNIPVSDIRDITIHIDELYDINSDYLNKTPSGVYDAQNRDYDIDIFLRENVDILLDVFQNASNEIIDLEISNQLSTSTTDAILFNFGEFEEIFTNKRLQTQKYMGTDYYYISTNPIYTKLPNPQLPGRTIPIVPRPVKPGWICIGSSLECVYSTSGGTLTYEQCLEVCKFTPPTTPPVPPPPPPTPPPPIIPPTPPPPIIPPTPPPPIIPPTPPPTMPPPTPPPPAIPPPPSPTPPPPIIPTTPPPPIIPTTPPPPIIPTTPPPTPPPDRPPPPPPSAPPPPSSTPAPPPPPSDPPGGVSGAPPPPPGGGGGGGGGGGAPLAPGAEKDKNPLEKTKPRAKYICADAAGCIPVTGLSFSYTSEFWSYPDEEECKFNCYDNWRCVYYDCVAYYDQENNRNQAYADKASCTYDCQVPQYWNCVNDQYCRRVGPFGGEFTKVTQCIINCVIPDTTLINRARVCSPCEMIRSMLNIKQTVTGPSITTKFNWTIGAPDGIMFYKGERENRDKSYQLLRECKFNWSNGRIVPYIDDSPNLPIIEGLGDSNYVGEDYVFYNDGKDLDGPGDLPILPLEGSVFSGKIPSLELISPRNLGYRFAGLGIGFYHINISGVFQSDYTLTRTEYEYEPFNKSTGVTNGRCGNTELASADILIAPRGNQGDNGRTYQWTDGQVQGLYDTGMYA